MFLIENQLFVRRSQCIRTKNPIHKQSEKAYMCFKTRRVRTRDFTVYEKQFIPVTAGSWAILATVTLWARAWWDLLLFWCHKESGTPWTKYIGQNILFAATRSRIVWNIFENWQWWFDETVWTILLVFCNWFRFFLSCLRVGCI